MALETVILVFCHLIRCLLQLSGGLELDLALGFCLPALDCSKVGGNILLH